MARDVYNADDFQYIRSPQSSRIHSFARFYNSTRHPATIIWIDFHGKGVKYSEGLEPRKWLDVNSYAGHRWVFVRTGTDERLVADGRTMWIGEPWTNSTDSAHPNRAKRKLVQLGKPVYSLRECCVYTIKSILSTNNRCTSHLPALPQNLVEELQHPLFRHLMPFKPRPDPQHRQNGRGDDRQHGQIIQREQRGEDMGGE